MRLFAITFGFLLLLACSSTSSAPIETAASSDAIAPVAPRADCLKDARAAAADSAAATYSGAAVSRVLKFDDGGFPGPTGEMTAGSGRQTSVLWPDPCSSKQIVATSSHQAGAGSPILPFVTLIDGATGAVTGPSEIASDTTAGAASTQHDIPSVALAFSGGFTCVAYGAQSTYRPYSPPESWYAFDERGGPGTTYAAEPMVCGSNLGGSNDPTSFLCTSECTVTSDSNKVFMPVTGISEAALAYRCVAPGCVEVTTGQVQSNAACSGSCNVVSGASAYETFHVTGRSAGYWDTTCGRQEMKTGAVASQLCIGDEQITHPPQGGDYFHFTVSGAGSGSLTVNGCSFSYPGTGSGATGELAAGVAASYNAACPKRFHAVASAQAAGTVGIEYTPSVSWTSLVAAADPSCSGGITCGAAVTDSCNCPRNASGYEHFNWGSIREFDGKFYQLTDVQLQTTSYRGAQHNNNALALALWISKGPDARGVWSWCDMAGANCTNVSPNSAPPQNLLGMGPGGSCTAGADCREPAMPSVSAYCAKNCRASFGASPYLIRPPGAYAENFPAFCYDWGPEANASCGVPVTSQRDWTVAGNELIAAYPCFSRGLNQTAICAIAVDMPTKRTVRTWIVDHADAGYSTFFAISLGVSANAAGVVKITAGIGNSSRWSHDALCTGTGTCLVQYRLAPPYTHAWSKGTTLVNSMGGKNTLAASCVIHADSEGLVVNASCANGAAGFPAIGGLQFFQFKV